MSSILVKVFQVTEGFVTKFKPHAMALTNLLWLLNSRNNEKFRYLLSNAVIAWLKNSPEKELGALCRPASTLTRSRISNLCYTLNIWHILLLPESIKCFSIKQLPKSYFFFNFFKGRQKSLLAFLHSTHGSYKATFIPACQVIWGPQVEAVNKIRSFCHHIIGTDETQVSQSFFCGSSRVLPSLRYPKVWNCWYAWEILGVFFYQHNVRLSF